MDTDPAVIEANLRQTAQDIAADKGCSLEEAVAILREGLTSAMVPPLAVTGP